MSDAGEPPVDAGTDERDGGGSEPIDSGTPVDAARDAGTCSAGLTRCDGECVDTSSDEAHCGGCGAACEPGENATAAACESGACVETCATGFTFCAGSGCVDLASDPDNCGACGYEAVGRSCEGGQPTPAWAPIGTTSAPLLPPSRVTWTGRELLYFGTLGSGEIMTYVPATDTWATAPAPPGGVASDPVYLVGMPDRGEALLVHSTGAFRWEHAAAGPRWREILMPPSLPTGTDVLNAAYSGDAVFLFETASAGSGVRLDLATDAWSAFGPSSVCTRYGGAGETGGGTYTYANGLAVMFANGDARGSSANHCAANQLVGLLDPSALTWTSASVSRTSLAVYAYTYLTTLPVGNSVYVGGGFDAALCDAGGGSLEARAPVLFDPRGTTTTVGYPTRPISSAFTAWTGRAILHWGGTQTNSNCATFGFRHFRDGWVGLVEDGSINWRAMPDAPAALTARGQLYGNNAQRLWTGRELLVIGGFDGDFGSPGTQPRGGYRYQPPVGCVCPRASGTPPSVADACSGVGEPPAVYAVCNPR